MPRLVAILNPNANRGRAAALAAKLQDAAGNRFDLTLRQTTCRGEAVDLARDAALAGCDAVIAIGGDGAVHEVANGLLAVPADSRPPLAIIPAGSGNDLAFALGISNNIAQNIELIERGATRTIDVALVNAADSRMRYAVNNVGALLEGQINLASHELHWPQGSGLYLRAALQTLLRRPPVAHLELCVDGRSFARDAIIFSLGNGPRSGGKFFLHPDATIDDGYFEYLVAGPMSRLGLLWQIAKSVKRGALNSRRIERGKFTNLAVRSDMALAAHVDGEPWLRPEEAVHELTVAVLPRELRVICN